MSQENVEIVRAAIEVNRSGDLVAVADAMIELADPAIEFRSSVAGLEGGVYRGHEGLRQYLENFADTWREWSNELREIEEVAPDTYIATFTFKAVGKNSGVPVERVITLVVTLSNGKLMRVLAHESRADALEAVGLSE
jgi:ketosteroid isomerase-like protein